MNKLNTIFKPKGQKVTVMETSNFYKTEIGQKVLADLSEKKWDHNRYGEYIGDRYMDGYVIKRGDDYFFVDHNGRLPGFEFTKETIVNPFSGESIVTNANLYLIHKYYITPITKGGKVDYGNRLEASMKAKLNYEDFSYKTGRSWSYGCGPDFTATDLQKRFKTYVNVRKDVLSRDVFSQNNRIDNSIFNKFIAPDPHWFECATHYAKRQEVLNGITHTVFRYGPTNKIREFLKLQRLIHNEKLSYRITKGARDICDAVRAKMQMDKRVRKR